MKLEQGYHGRLLAKLKKASGQLTIQQEDGGGNAGIVDCDTFEL